jgi:hypothetical protein
MSLWGLLFPWTPDARPARQEIQITFFAGKAAGACKPNIDTLQSQARIVPMVYKPTMFESGNMRVIANATVQKQCSYEPIKDGTG